MIAGILGDKTFKDTKKIEKALAQYKKIDALITGEGKQVFKDAQTIAARREIPVRVVEMEWKNDGSPAGPRRDQKIIDESEIVFLFYDECGDEARSLIAYARARDREIVINNATMAARLTSTKKR